MHIIIYICKGEYDTPLLSIRGIPIEKQHRGTNNKVSEHCSNVRIATVAINVRFQTS